MDPAASNMDPAASNKRKIEELRSHSPPVVNIELTQGCRSAPEGAPQPEPIPEEHVQTHALQLNQLYLIYLVARPKSATLTPLAAPSDVEQS